MDQGPFFPINHRLKYIYYDTSIIPARLLPCSMIVFSQKLNFYQLFFSKFWPFKFLQVSILLHFNKFL